MNSIPKIGDIVEIDEVKYSVEPEEMPLECKGCDLDNDSYLCLQVICHGLILKKVEE